MNDEKKCPFCAEIIQSDAVKCKHCGEWLDTKKKKNNIYLILAILAFLMGIVIGIVQLNLSALPNLFTPFNIGVLETHGLLTLVFSLMGVISILVSLKHKEISLYICVTATIGCVLTSGILFLIPMTFLIIYIKLLINKIYVRLSSKSLIVIIFVNLLILSSLLILGENKTDVFAYFTDERIEYKYGEDLDTYNLAFKINQSEIKKQLQINQIMHNAKDYFLVYDIEVTNYGPRNQLLHMSQFRAIDSKNNLIEANSKLTKKVSDPAFNYYSLNPGETIKAKIVFNVKRQNNEYNLMITEGVFNGTKYTVVFSQLNDESLGVQDSKSESTTEIAPSTSEPTTENTTEFKKSEFVYDQEAFKPYEMFFSKYYLMEPFTENQMKLEDAFYYTIQFLDDSQYYDYYDDEGYNYISEALVQEYAKYLFNTDLSSYTEYDSNYKYELINDEWYYGLTFSDGINGFYFPVRIIEKDGRIEVYAIEGYAYAVDDVEIYRYSRATFKLNSFSPYGIQLISLMETTKQQVLGDFELEDIFDERGFKYTE